MVMIVGCTLAGEGRVVLEVEYAWLVKSGGVLAVGCTRNKMGGE